jgi:hypothetical protein
MIIMRSRVIEWAVWWLVLFIITFWSILFFVNDNDTKGFMGGLTISLLIALAMWQKGLKRRLPSNFIVMLYVFIFIAVGLGTFGGLYKVNRFDDFLHFSSGIIAGYGSWILLYYLVGKKLVTQLPNSFIVLYVIIFVLAIAGFWELLEFAGDKWFHFTAQGRDPDDTMIDMIDGLAGGILFVAILINRLKKDQHRVDLSQTKYSENHSLD